MDAIAPTGLNLHHNDSNRLLETSFPLTPEELRKMHAYWRAANYISVGQLYLYNNPLLREPLKLTDVKPVVVGHPWDSAVDLCHRGRIRPALACHLGGARVAAGLGGRHASHRPVVVPVPSARWRSSRWFPALAADPRPGQGWRSAAQGHRGGAPAGLGRQLYRLSAAGMQDGMAVVQSFHLLSGPDGQQIAVTCLTKQETAGKIGTRDVALVNAIDFPAKK